MQRAGEKSWTNATHLVIAEKSTRWRAASDAGPSERRRVSVAGGRQRRGELVPAEACDRAELWVTRTVTLHDGAQVAVKSGFQCLKEPPINCRRRRTAECGVPVARIAALAEVFTAHGRKAAVVAHGGMMAANGFYNTGR